MTWSDSADNDTLRILVVDDDVMSLHLTQAFLHKFGYDPITVDSGQAALDVLERETVDLIISDLHMDGIDGLELCRRLRARPSSHYVSFILLTGDDGTDTLTTVIDTGADDYMVKPIREKELRLRLRACKRITALTRDLRHQNTSLEQANGKLIEANDDLSEAYRIITRDLEEAARVHKALLPPPARFPALDLCWTFLPSHYLAGDMLGYFRLDEEHVGFYVLDVAGHGTSAALQSFRVNKMLSQNVVSYRLLKRPLPEPPYYMLTPPDEAIAELNKRIYSDQDTERYFTIVYGVINFNTGELRLTQAGHPAPLWLRRRRRTTSAVGRGGFPVGLLEQAEYEQITLQLAPGDRIYLYSDGVTECRNGDGEQFSESRLVQAVEQYAEHPLAASMEGLNEILQHWQDNDQFGDDVTVLALEWQPEAEKAQDNG